MGALAAPGAVRQGIALGREVPAVSRKNAVAEPAAEDVDDAVTTAPQTS